MGALIDLTGQRFGHLTVARRLSDVVTGSGARQPAWGCICACGRRTVEQGRALRAGRALSCRQCVRDPSRMLKYGTTYLVYWPALGVLKIGRAFRGSRLEMMRQSGGQVLLAARDTDGSWETAGLQALRRLFDPAFEGPTAEGPHSADRILARGRGWSECFTVELSDLQLAFDICLRAFAREGNDFGYNPPATPAWRRALTSVQRARAAHRGRADRARTAEAGGARADAPRPCQGRRAALPSRPTRLVDGARHPARSDARGGRLPQHVGGPRGRVAAAARPDSAARTAPIFTGWEERGRERGTRTSARAGTCESASASGRRAPRLGGPLGGTHPANPHPAGTPAALAGAALRMPESPKRDHHGGVRPLRHGGQAAQEVPHRASVPRAAGHLRGSERGEHRR